MEEVPHSRQPTVDFFQQYVEQYKHELIGKKVIDLSAGSGFIANLFVEKGSEVLLYDLFPDQNRHCPRACQFIDLQKPFPIVSDTADIVICAETMEHLPNQFYFFQEAARILKPNGNLIITTPNVSSLRGRLSQFLGESEHYSTPLPNEANAFTRWPESKEGYFSKIFLSGILRLRLLAALQGLTINKIEKTKSSSTSSWLMIFYPIVFYFSYKNYRKELTADPSNRKILLEIFNLNISLKILLSKQLIIQFTKTR